MSMNKHPKILVVGSLVMDMITSTAIFPKEGATVLGHSFHTAPGGKGANQAMQAALLGADVTMVGKVGEDSFGDTLINSLASAGVNTDHITRSKDAASAIGNITLTTQEGKTLQNRIIVVPGANMELSLKDVSFLQQCIEEFDYVMLQLEIPMEVNQKVAQLAKAKGVPVMLNPAPIAKIPNDLLENLTYLSPNETEANELLHIELNTDVELFDENATKIKRAMKQNNIDTLLITLGGSGAAIIQNGIVLKRPCVPNIQVIDPTAAGDSFVAAFCVARCWGLSEEKALEFANYTAAVTVSGLGAQPSLPRLKDVLQLMETNNYNDSEIQRFLVEKANDQMGTCSRSTSEALTYFLNSAGEVVLEELKEIDRDSLLKAAECIQSARERGNRIHITGIGKPGHLAGYAASLFSSTGTPTYFLHGTEAVHGSCGQLVEGDVVICISNSGETMELQSTVIAVRDNGCKIIGISGNVNSWLANNSDIFIPAVAKEEGGPLNRAPRNSILVETIVLQALSVILQADCDLTPKEYVKRHPGGTLGKLRSAEQKSY